uniref:NPC1 like intracellular cholesterol transporter 1 n=1 Tax=Salvator merianae TaxID=96440 RepID=A0A8D0DMQ5_SALMN
MLCAHTNVLLLQLLICSSAPFPSHETQATAVKQIHEAGRCSFYGECGKNPEAGNSLLLADVPCLSNREAPLLNGSHLSLLQKICPMLFTGTRTTRACCSEAQLRALQKSLALSQAVLLRCPSCAENFANIYCQNTCSPNQSLFTNVTRSFTRNTTEGVVQVGVLEYQCYYNLHFADKLFDSCKGVRMPATGGYAISAMCGKYGATLCNSQRWLDFQGDVNNGLAPLTISFHLTPGDAVVGDNIVPLNGTAWMCNEAVNNGTGEECSCQDCAQACPAIPAPVPASKGFYVGKLDGRIFVCYLLLGCLALSLGCCCLWRRCCVSQKQKLMPEATKSSWSEKASQVIYDFLGRMFKSWGTLVASHPFPVIAISLAVIVGLSCGLVHIQLTTDPVELWSSPQSQARQEKAFYDEHFGPFFRTNQVILTAKGRPNYTYNSLILGKTNFSGILSKDVLLDLLELQTKLQEIKVWSGKHSRNVSLEDVCYAPLNPQNATLSDCAVNSLLQYFQNNATRLNLTATQTVKGEMGTVDWRDHFLYCQAGSKALLGNFFHDHPFPTTGEAYSESQALILTFSLNNFPPNDPRFDFVMLWEEQFLEIVQEFQKKYADNYTVAFMAERSLEDEISRTTWEDLNIFVVSYLVIFLYIALALGEYSSCRQIMVNSKVTLGLGGIVVVLGAVLSSLGFYSFVGLPSSLIILEVVPFLVLAVGADNIFIFVLEYQVRDVPQAGETTEQHIGRILGDVAPSMLLCSLSEVVSFFLGAMSKMPAVRTFALNAALAVFFDFLLQMSMFVALMSLDARRQKAARFDVCCCIRLKKTDAVKRQEEGKLCSFMRKFYTPFLFHRVVRVLVVSVGQGSSDKMKDSYMLQYFQYLNQYFMVGAPTYFVTTGGYNFSTVQGMNGVCSSSGCDDNSMTQKIQYATKSFLAIPASSWVDDFIDWLSPYSSCCRIHSFGPNKASISCFLSKCMPQTNGTLRPNPEEFNRFLPWFLHDMPNLKCPKGWLYCCTQKIAPFLYDTAGLCNPLAGLTAFSSACRITYVFYEQYLTISTDGLINVALCLVPTFVVCWVFLGLDLRSAFINLLTIIMIVVDTVGAMTLWGISYNAVALINLVTAVGISVEFVSHITRSFAISTQPSKLERAREATISMGSAVFAGVAMTNLPGIVVLAFAKAQLIQIFFFRLNLLITLLGTLHGLVFLPVLLSYFGKSFLCSFFFPIPQGSE